MVGPVKDSGSGLLSQSSQALRHADLERTWLRLIPSEVQTHARTHRGFWFLTILFDIPDLHLDPQRSWLRPTPSEDPDSRLDPQRSLVPAYSLGDPRFKPRPTGVLA